MASNDSGDGKDDGGLGPVKSVLLIGIAIVAGFYGIKLTFWLLKTALLVAAVGAVGYVGYRLVSGKLLSSSKETDPEKLLEHTPTPAQKPKPPVKPSTAASPSAAARPPASDFDSDAALEELKRRMNEE
ncbi:MAG: hypothetical protein KC561_02695 [Myxococcales bacterium]|nr:hypothetical protein [Myxococcales bacterium]